MSKSIYYTHQASKKKKKKTLCHVHFNRKTKNKKVTVIKVVANV